MKTGSDALLDTTAWWHIIEGTPTGVAIHARFLAPRTFAIHASALSLGEIAAKFDLIGRSEDAETAIRMIRQIAHLHEVTAELAIEGGHARSVLRKAAKAASLVDGIILATARALDVTLVSDDPAFAKVRRVAWEKGNP